MNPYGTTTLDPADALNNLLSTGITALGGAGLNLGLGEINGYAVNDGIYPYQYGAPVPTLGQPTSSLFSLLVLFLLVWGVVKLVRG